MNNLLNEVLQWMQMNNYRRASFDRLCGIIPSAATYDQLDGLIFDYPDIFRTARIKGGMEGLALQDHISFSEALALVNPPPLPPSLETLLVEDEEPPQLAPPIFAPKVTVNEVEGEIVNEYYRNVGSAVKAPIGSSLYNVTLCIFELRNGFTIVGKSACVNSENFNEEIGRQLAREDAVKQVWPFLGFRLADKRVAA
jgi:hypothetical protein